MDYGVPLSLALSRKGERGFMDQGPECIHGLSPGPDSKHTTQLKNAFPLPLRERARERGRVNP
ncbi:MAG: hypothetical protein ABW098_00290 [Candidatus Thiodiazotropha sp.]